MHLIPTLTLLATATATATATALAASTPLYATHYSGQVYTLRLGTGTPARNATGNTNTNLNIASAATTCGSMPSWLTLDPKKKVLYCTDETEEAGSLTVLTATESGGSGGGGDDDGRISEIAKTGDVGGGVNSVVYRGHGEREYLAVAHYSTSTLTTHTLPIHPGQSLHQTLNFTNTKHGPKKQQDRSHPHQVLLDPRGSFILSADLGDDRIRVLEIDKQTGMLREGCPDIQFESGSGPRHGVFYYRPGRQDHDHDHGQGQTMLYTVSELGGNLTVFSVEYPRDSGGGGGCPRFYQKQSIIPYPNNTLPSGATPAAIKLVDDYLYVSIRSDNGFSDTAAAAAGESGKSDSIITLTVSSEDEGRVTLRDMTPSYGLVPRTIALNKAGDLLAIGNQASASVAVVRRDVGSGKLGEMLASVDVGEKGKVGAAEGLSSVVFGDI